MEDDKNIRLEYSPFDDPIVSACFANVETAGEAVRSLANSITEKDGIVIAKVNSVTPQSYSKIPGERGTRVDVKSKTEANQDIIIEVNMYTDNTIHQRNYLAAAQIAVSTSMANTTHAQMVKMLPYVIAINILNYEIRRDNDDWLQPIKCVYEKSPHTVVIPQFVCYDIELPKFKNAAPDWNDTLYCWVYALVRAHEEHKTMKEVIEMVPELQSFAAENIGFRQFSERYEFVATDAQVRDEYQKWIRECIRQEGILTAAEEKGEHKATFNIARKMLKRNKPIDEIIEFTGLSHDEIIALQ